MDGAGVGAARLGRPRPQRAGVMGRAELVRQVFEEAVRMVRCTVLGWMAAAAICRGAEPVRLTAQPQKFRTFYSLDDAQVPAALKQPGATARAVASAGAVWYGTPHGGTRFA